MFHIISVVSFPELVVIVAVGDFVIESHSKGYQ